MAPNSTATRALARFAKRFSAPASLSPLPAFRRNVHGSNYDKNLDEHVRPAVVPDEIIKPESEKYWAPNPQTGVFGPANEASQGGSGGHRSASNSADSVLEEKAFFRPLEDLEKPQHP